jgi:hypothetical protein
MLPRYVRRHVKQAMQGFVFGTAAVNTSWGRTRRARKARARINRIAVRMGQRAPFAKGA